MDKIAVLIPCYNEELTIGKVVSDWHAVLPEAVVYVYDNNSSDSTVLMATRAGAVVKHEPMQGKGNVIRRMFREIDAECYIMVDGDDTYPASYGPEMVRRVLEQNDDMVIGDRLSSTYYNENKRPFHNFGNNFVRFLVNKLFKADIPDIMTGYRAFSYEFVKTFPVLSRGFEIETEMTIHAIDKSMAISSVCIDYRDRPSGSESKLDTYSDGLKVLRTINRLHRSYHPLVHMRYISIISLMASLVGVTVGYGRKWKKLANVISCIFAVIASSAYFSGYIMELISLKSRQDFEQKRIFVHNEQQKKEV